MDYVNRTVHNVLSSIAAEVAHKKFFKKLDKMSFEDIYEAGVMAKGTVLNPTYENLVFWDAFEEYLEDNHQEELWETINE